MLVTIFFCYEPHIALFAINANIRDMLQHVASAKKLSTTQATLMFSFTMVDETSVSPEIAAIRKCSAAVLTRNALFNFSCVFTVVKWWLSLPLFNEFFYVSFEQIAALDSGFIGTA